MFSSFKTPVSSQQVLKFPDINMSQFSEAIHDVLSLSERSEQLGQITVASSTDTSVPPQTLQAWRECVAPDGFFRSAWDPLEPFFISKGYHLFVAAVLPGQVLIPNPEPRAEDGYTYNTPHNPEGAPKGCSIIVSNNLISSYIYLLAILANHSLPRENIGQP